MRLMSKMAVGLTVLLGSASFGQTWLGNLSPTGVSDNKIVCGFTTPSSRAVVWEEGQITQLPYPSSGTCGFSRANSISRDGRVVVGLDGPSCGGDGYPAAWQRISQGNWLLVTFQLGSYGIASTGGALDIADNPSEEGVYYVLIGGYGPPFAGVARLSLSSNTATVVCIYTPDSGIGWGGLHSFGMNQSIISHPVQSDGRRVNFRSITTCSLYSDITYPTPVVDISNNGIILGQTWVELPLHRLVNLPLPSDAIAIQATDISEDGNIIVGTATLPDNYTRAVIWKRDGENYIAEYLGGPNLRTATAVSANGRYIVGKGINPSTFVEEGYLFEMPEPCRLPTDIDGNGIVDDSDLLQVLFDFGRSCP